MQEIHSRSVDMSSLPFRLLLIMLVVIFFVEGIVMYIIHQLQPLAPQIEGLLDAALLTVFVSPVLYHFFFRPMSRQIKLSQKAREDLQRIKDELEERVAERTRELTAINETLSNEITERSRVESRLRESETRMRSLTESAKDAIISIDSEGKVIFWNKSAELIFGYSEEEMLGQSLTVIIPERYREDHRRALERFMATGKQKLIGKIVEMSGRGKDGREFPIELSLSTWQIEQQTFFTGIVREISARKKAEEQLRKLTRAVEQSPALVIITDIDGTIEYVNPKFTEVTGYTREEAIGQNPRFLKSGKHPPEFYKELWDTIKSGNEWRGDFVNKKKNGELYWEAASIAPVQDEKGVITHFVAVKADVTKQRLAEEALRRSVEKYRTIIENIQDGYYEVDLDGNFTFVNNALCRIMGYSADELTGMNYRDYTDDLNAQKVYKTFNHVYRTGKPAELSDWQIIRKDGEVRSIEASISTLKDVTGRIIGSMGIVRDITARKKAEEKLKQSEERYRVLAEQLDESNSIKELLLDIITHDLQGPAGVIQGMAEILLSEDPENDELQLIQTSSRALLKVVTNADTLSNIAVGEEIEKESLDLAEVIKDVLKEFVHALENTGMNLETHLPETLPVRANPIIAEVFRNYISNAIKYAHRGGKIVIEAGKDEEYITIYIKDFGESIAKENYERIFERRMQLEKDKPQGKGLGLAIVKRIADAHNAKVWVEPNYPSGNIFCLKLPREKK